MRFSSSPSSSPISPTTLLCALLCAGSLWTPSNAEAGPWVRSPGSVYTKLGATLFSAESSFNLGQDTGLQYEGQTYNLYAEVGLPGRFQVIADVPFVIGRNNSKNGVNYINRTFGDARFEVAYGLFDDLPLTLAVETKVPLYDPVSSPESDDTFRNFPASRFSFPDAGDGQVDITPKIQAGVSFHPVPAWLVAELGYRVRLDGFVDGVFSSLNAGYFLVPDIIALGVFASSVLNVADDPNPELKATREFVYTQGFLLLQHNPTLPGVGLTVSAGFLPYAANSAAGQDFGVGLSYAY